ncbi:MAG: Hsp20/alpha crystallin family protein [Candidatus Altiarchaeota archaeon]
MAYWDPFEEMDRAFARMFRDVNRPLLTGKNDKPVVRPLTDVIDGKDSITVRLDIPGTDKDSIDIKLTDDTLTVTSERKSEEEKEDEGYHMCERRYSSFLRSMKLPAEVDADKTKAKYKDGVLEIKLAKKSKTDKSHKIKIE